MEYSTLPITKLSRGDIAALAPRKWLNDEIVEFGIRFVSGVYINIFRSNLLCLEFGAGKS
jgi:Ulp1 family protease